MVRSFSYFSSKLTTTEAEENLCFFKVRHNFYDVCSPIFLLCVWRPFVALVHPSLKMFASVHLKNSSQSQNLSSLLYNELIRWLKREHCNWHSSKFWLGILSRSFFNTLDVREDAIISSDCSYPRLHHWFLYQNMQWEGKVSL